MKSLSSLCAIGGSLVIAAAGISGLIDQSTMIVLVIVLICCTPNARRCCFPRKG